jgi:hypothetical protein
MAPCHSMSIFKTSGFGPGRFSRMTVGLRRCFVLAFIGCLFFGSLVRLKFVHRSSGPQWQSYHLIHKTEPVSICRGKFGLSLLQRMAHRDKERPHAIENWSNFFLPLLATRLIVCYGFDLLCNIPWQGKLSYELTPL